MKYITILVIVSILASNLNCRVLDGSSSDIIFAIDVGSQIPTQTKSGLQFSHDTHYGPNSQISDYLEDQNLQGVKIKYTQDPVIFKTERHSHDSFSYNLPLQKEGEYVLILQFCELYFKKPNQRKVNIQFGDLTVLENLDIVEKVGYYAALQEYIPFKLVGGQIYHNGKLASNALIDGALNLRFIKTKYDLPKVDGIVLVKGGLQDTDYDEYHYLLKNWDKILKDEENAKEHEKQKINEKKKKMVLDNNIPYFEMF